MKLTIIPSDKAVYKDDDVFMGLDLSSANIPADVHALQWNETKGWIEYTENVKENEPITELPAWASECISLWQSARFAEDARIAAEEAAEAAKNNTPV